MTATLSRARQRRIGIALAIAIGAAWLTIHIGGIFFWRWSAWTILPALALVLIQTWLSTGLFILAHDAMHGSLVPGRPRVNRAIGRVCLMIYAGLDFNRLAPKHALHHHHAGTADDPDYHPVTPHRAGPWFVAFFSTYYSHAQILRIAAASLLYVLIGATMLNIIVFWAVPAVLALGQLFWFGTYLPHREAEDGFPDRHRARSTSLSPLASLLTCFHFGGFHHEHHLSPGTPWWALPQVRRARAG